MKKLKQLKLKKQTIVNLNALEMNNIKGGTGTLTPSSEICTIAISYTVEEIINYTINLYNQTKSNSPYDCHKQSEYKNVVGGVTQQPSDVYREGYCAVSVFEVVCY